MRQIIYESISTGSSAAASAPGVLPGARAFNGMNGVTGLLCATGNRFLQVLEGPEESVGLAMDRIVADPLHGHIVVLVHKAIEARSFADWSMAYRDEGHPAALLAERVQMLIAGAPAIIGDHFRRFVG